MIDFGPTYEPIPSTPVPEGDKAWADPLRAKQSGIVSRARAGDTEALSLLLQQARPLILRWALQRIKDPDDAEDIAQQVLLRATTSIENFRGHSTLSTWLYRITANEVTVFCRKWANRCRSAEVEAPLHELSEGDPWSPETLDREKACRKVRALTKVLPPLQQAAFRLVDVDGLRPCEAAEALGRTQTNLRSSLCRARSRIREIVLESHRELSEEFADGGW